MNRSSLPKPGHKKTFTLIELLIVVAILGVLAAAVTVILNPVELLAQSRDATRLSDMGTISKAISLAQVYNVPLCNTPNTIYVSVPDASSTSCGDLGLPAAPGGYTYSCVTPSNLKNINGTGWIPINFASSTTGSPLPNLPIDPTNSISSGLYYLYACNSTSYQISSNPESSKYKSQSTLFAAGTNPSLVSLSGGPVTHGSSTIAYSGSVQSWTVPSGITSITITAYGSAGIATAYAAGGNGSIAAGTLGVTPGSTLYIGFISGGTGNGNGGNGGYASWLGTYNTFSAVSNLPVLVAAGGGGGAGSGASGAGGAGGGAGFGGGGAGGGAQGQNGGAGGSLGSGVGGSASTSSAGAGTGGAGGGGAGNTSGGTATAGTNGNGTTANGTGGTGGGPSGVGGTGSNSGLNTAGGGGGGTGGGSAGTGAAGGSNGGGGGNCMSGYSCSGGNEPGGGGAGSIYLSGSLTSTSGTYSNTTTGTAGTYVYITY